MKKLLSNKKFHYFLFTVFLLYGIWARFANLTWGSPFFFHPDENNITYAIKNISFPTQMNPHFFAYGSFPIYVIYFTSLFASQFRTPPFEVIAYTSRTYSALLSIGIMLSLFFIGKKIFSTSSGIIAASLSAVGVGFIEYAHFGTFEMWLTFLSLWFFYWWYLFTIRPSLKILFSLGVLSGLLLGTKVSTAVLFVLPFLSLCFFYIKHKKKYEDIAKFILIYILPLIVIFFLTNPYVIVDFPSFWSSMKYESSVALGTLLVFYTQGFVHTIPVIFQFLFVYPFLLNPVITAFFLPAFLIIFYKSTKQKNPSHPLLITYYLLLFFSQAFLFVKWTRYMVPTLPFIYLLIAECVSALPKKIQLITFSTLLGIGLLYSFAFLHTTYLVEDSRVVAASWANTHIPHETNALSEPYDLGLLPFNTYFSHIKLFEFYTFDENPTQNNMLYNQILPVTSTIILPSQRLVRSRRIYPYGFPLSSVFYANLFKGKLGYQRVYETPCDILCQIVYIGNPITNIEETASVFDHPIVFIFNRQ